jgi:hypothetical protein
MIKAEQVITGLRSWGIALLFSIKTRMRKGCESNCVKSV